MKKRWFKSATETITDGNLESYLSESKTPLLLNFWAPWSGNSKLMKEPVEVAARMLRGQIRVGIVNFDLELGLATRFGIHDTPAFVLIHNGQVVQTFECVTSSGGLVQRIQYYLAEC